MPSSDRWAAGEAGLGPYAAIAGGGRARISSRAGGSRARPHPTAGRWLLREGQHAGASHRPCRRSCESIATTTRWTPCSPGAMSRFVSAGASARRRRQRHEVDVEIRPALALRSNWSRAWRVVGGAGGRRWRSRSARWSGCAICPSLVGSRLAVAQAPVVCEGCERTFTKTHPALPSRQRVSARFRAHLFERCRGGGAHAEVARDERTSRYAARLAAARRSTPESDRASRRPPVLNTSAASRQPAPA